MKDLADLVDRGLASDQPLLFGIDGAKALRKAIRAVFGSRAVVQRCQVGPLKNRVFAGAGVDGPARSRRFATVLPFKPSARHGCLERVVGRPGRTTGRQEASRRAA